MLCQCANCRTPYILCQCDILATRCSIPTSCVASWIVYHMLCQCVITSHRDILSHVTYCRTSARELWAHPPPPPRTLLAADVARHTASRHASLRSARSEATLRSSQFGVTHYNYYRIAEDVARYAATLHTSLRSAHAKRSVASLVVDSRGPYRIECILA